MDPSSSSRFSTAEAEASLSTEVVVVAELEATKMVGAEGASTSWGTEYYSARCEEMMRSRDQFSDDIALEIEFSKPHWSEVSRLEVAPQSAEEEELNRENKELLQQFKEEYPLLFLHDLHGYVLGRMIAKGGQAEIYEVVGLPYYLMKVFERGTSLRDLRGSWPLPVLKKDVCQCIWWAGMMKDGRFGFVMERFWGDLRKLIDLAMLEKNVDGIQRAPFPYKWKDYNRWTFYPVHLMLGIAVHMLGLHKQGISHRDLKASNILLDRNFEIGNTYLNVHYMTGIVVADFECSIGVLGTGFWRAPEVFLAQEKRETMSNEQWKAADVYSYGMTCFEIVTGKIPFDGETSKFENTKANRQRVIDGKRPKLPSDLDDAVKDLITKCWESNPKLRPTFVEIVEMVESISKRQCEFRLFGNGDELPRQYRLATVQEVNDFPIALMKAVTKREIANLANGSVDGYLYGMNTRLKRRSNVGHKLARLHQ